MSDKCNVSGCNNENNGSWVCDKHEWIADLELKFDDVMQEIWNGNMHDAETELYLAEGIFKRHRHDS